jgi:hypothetical protein
MASFPHMHNSEFPLLTFLDHLQWFKTLHWENGINESV